MTANSDGLNAPFEKNAEAVERFARDGFVRIPQALPHAVLDAYGPAITAATLRFRTEQRPLEERNTYDRAFLQVMNLWRVDGMARDFVFGKRLAGIAADLLGVKGVRLYHDQALYKEPSGGITPAHADQFYWPLATDRTVTAWIPLQPVPAEMGPLAFYRGSHKVGFGRDLAISDESEVRITREMEAQGFHLDQAPYAYGDVSFHGGWTFHRADANQSSTPRAVMTIIYMDADMRVAEPVNDMQRHDMGQWLPGLGAGDLAASEINPVLFSRG